MKKSVLIILLVVVGALAVFAPIMGLMIVGANLGSHLDKPSGSAFTAGSATYTGVYPTVYCPCDDSGGIEGGKFDDMGKPLRTLQQFLNGSADYVSVAMDIAIRSDKGARTGPYSYGTIIRIPEMEEKYNNGAYIEFRLVDNGGSFNGTHKHPMDGQVKPRGFTAIDIAVDARPGSQKPDEAALKWRSDPVTLIFYGGSTGAAGKTFTCSNGLYAFPIVSSTRPSYLKTHHNYSATDIFVYDSKRKPTKGQSIVAVTNGVVTYVNKRGRGDGGFALGFKGDDGLIYYYAHLQNAPAFRKNDRVRAGQVIGKLGDTGNAKKNPHLHFGISSGQQLEGYYPSKVIDPRTQGAKEGPAQVSNHKVLDAWWSGTCIDPRLP